MRRGNYSQDGRLCWKWTIGGHVEHELLRVITSCFLKNLLKADMLLSNITWLATEDGEKSYVSLA